MIVEVRPIEKVKWHGKTEREAFARPIAIEALVSKSTGQFATGLSQEDRERLEAATGFNLSPDYHIDMKDSFWTSTTAQIKLEHKTNIFNTKKPLDEIKINVLKASDLVANSQREYEQGMFPGALFVIFNEQEETEIKASRAAVKRKVIMEAAKLSKEKKAEIIQVLMAITVKHQSADYVDLKFDETIEQHGAELVLAYIKKDKTRLATHALILEAIHKGVLRKEGASVYYMSDQLGFDIESTIDYFLDINNQMLKIQILEKIN